jgi:uncharacterized protein (TIGR02145 family)
MKIILPFLFLVIACLSSYSQETGTVTDPRDSKVYRTVKIGNQWIMAENLAYRPEEGVYWADTTYFEKDIKVSFILDNSRTHFENGKIHLTVKSGDNFDLGNNRATIPKLFNSEAIYGYLIFDSTKYFRKSLFDGYLVLDSAFFKRYGCLYDFETAKASAIPGWHVPTNDELKELYKYVDGNAKEKYTALLEGGSSGFNAVLAGWGGFLTNYFKFRDIVEQRAGFWSSSKAGYMGVCLDFEGPPALREGAVRIGTINVNTGFSVRLFKDN